MATRGVNKVILIGNLGADPDVRYMQSGDAVCNLSIATSESWKDKQTGEAKERTEWHRCVFFGKLAEIAKEYLRKGSKIYVEGQLRTRKWTDKDGVDRYTTEVHVGVGGSMQMLDPKPGNGETRTGNGNGNAGQTRSGRPPEPPADAAFDDDIPF